MKNDFRKVNVFNNFYQTSSFYPMPVVMVTTLNEEGLTNIGSYSLCFPFGIADEHYMMLISRGDSNTSVNIRERKYCALNFIPYRRKLLKNAVRLGYPGEPTRQKLEDSIFTLIPSMREEKEAGVNYPEVISDAIEIFECTWEDDYNKFHFEGSPGESHYLLRINNIFMKSKWYTCLSEGKGFPSMPVDFGYRDSKNFWFAKHSRPFPEPIPSDKGVNIDTIKYAVERLGYDLVWEEAACEKLVKVPRVFLQRVLTGISERAVEKGYKVITPEVMDEFNQKKR
ncbi:MAG: hypothetical protein JXQ23_10500 [Clostridia bacterium]|nr:hypothetical protein [Clostridia bacterium]